MLACLHTGMFQKTVDSTVSSMSAIIVKQTDTMGGLVHAFQPAGVAAQSSSSSSSTPNISSSDMDNKKATTGNTMARRVQAISNALKSFYEGCGMEAPTFDSPKALIEAALNLLEDDELAEECLRLPLLPRLELLLTKGFNIPV
jgi:hypothetical protein